MPFGWADQELIAKRIHFRNVLPTRLPESVRVGAIAPRLPMEDSESSCKQLLEKVQGSDRKVDTFKGRLRWTAARTLGASHETRRVSRSSLILL
jgi:hypothetical protein